MANDAVLENYVLSRWQKTLPAKSPDLKAVIALLKPRVQTINALVNHCCYFYQRAMPTRQEIATYLTPAALSLLDRFSKVLEHLADWTQQSLHQALLDFLCARGY